MQFNIRPAAGCFHFESEDIMQAANNVSDESFFSQEVERGFTTTLWPEMLRIHRIAAQTIRDLGCQTVFEIGSGLGAFLIGCQSVGLDAVGMDRNPFEREFALNHGVDANNYVIGDIATFKIPRVFDCINCVEVFEHCSDEELAPICRQLADNCRWFYFTSTPYTDERDSEWGHINMKSREQWIDFFTSHGLTFARDDRSLVDWGLLFRGKAA